MHSCEVAEVKLTAVQIATARYFDVGVEHLLENSRANNRIVDARHIARFVERELTGASFPILAKLYRRGDHATMLLSHRHVAERVAAGDARYVAPVEAIIAAVKAEADRRSAQGVQLVVHQTLDEMACPTCGAPIIRELQRQIAELREQVHTLTGVQK